ncbi:hypothetical protein B0H19DRAFT_1249599 [Mycena capillaripes]|nr:hypothetical protein B0H19DRAFT_1249599 [Mycena capillaripes]
MLRELEVHIMDPSRGTFSAINFPWAQLTSFRGDGLSAEDCFKVFHFAPHLEYCTFSGWYGVDGFPTTPLSLPNLRSLSLLNPEQLGWFPGALTLPRLENFQLSIMARQLPSLFKFISRSSCSQDIEDKIVNPIILRSFIGAL